MVSVKLNPLFLNEGLNSIELQKKQTQQKSQLKTNGLALSHNALLSNYNANHLKANFLPFKGFSAFGSDSELPEFNVIHYTGVKLKDVGGISEIKDIIKNRVIEYMKHPEKFAEQGAKIPKGILLYGPPGTGKTLLAKAIAGEAELPLISVSGSDFAQKYLGDGPKAVKALFVKAREVVTDTPAHKVIVLIDEFDSLAGARGKDNEHNEDRKVLNQFLREMDGTTDNKGIIFLAATNRLEDLDAAAIRPGRFDYTLKIPNPSRNKQARTEILAIHSLDKKFKSEEDKKKVLEEGAKITRGLSGAQLAEVMNRAANFAALRDEPKYITTNDIFESKIELLAGPKVFSDLPKWDKENTVAHECGHALVGQVLSDFAKNPWEKPHQNSIISLDERDKFLGAVFTDEGENPHMSFNSMLAEAAVCYGSYNIERARLGGTNLDGVSEDLKVATEIITDGVTALGLGPNTKQVCAKANDYAKSAVTQEVSKDIKQISDSASLIAKKIIDFHREFIEEYVGLYKEVAGKGGNNFSGEEYKKLLDDWYKKTGKDKELPTLKKEIEKIQQSAKTEFNSDNNEVVKTTK